MSSDSERLLIQQIRQGDARAWETVIARYEGRLLAFVERRLHDRAASEDVVQESFIGFLNSLPNFDERRSLQAYLFTIASHKLADQLRRLGRHPLRCSSAHSADVLEQQLDQHAAASSIARSAERRQLENAAIVRCLGLMVRQWQEDGDYLRLKMTELLWVKGWTNRDVASFLQVSEQKVANCRFAVVKKLSEHIRNAGLPTDVFPELTSTAEE
jgi:RNA polymerase sigma-70 factor (ECF subfamily)